VGLRPEDIEIASEGQAGALPFDVEFIEELGATQLFHGKLAGQPFVMQAATGDVAAEAKRLWISVDPDRVHVFDAQSGVRLGREQRDQ
ncbi:MAG: TOBE domain-containing protein, partial [Ensifer adhaerens]